MSNIIDWKGTIKIPGREDPFVYKSRDPFPELDPFVIFFHGKVEMPYSEQNLRYGNLTDVDCGSNCIIQTLGGEDVVETKVSMLFYLIRKQNEEKKGPLLKNGFYNLFFIKNSNGDMCVVNIRFLEVKRTSSIDSFNRSEMDVELVQKEGQYLWNPGARIFIPSRKK